jgi:hypothetical protein
MTPKQKAQEIYNKLVVNIQRYDEYVDDRSKFKTIQCALIAVEEIINSSPLEPAHPYDYVIAEREAMEFWQEVKNEINKL